MMQESKDHEWISKSGRSWSPRVKSDLCAKCSHTPDTHTKIRKFHQQDILNLPEWYQPMYNGAGSCPWCENFRYEGHALDCDRKLVLEILEIALSEPEIADIANVSNSTTKVASRRKSKR